MGIFIKGKIYLVTYVVFTSIHNIMVQCHTYDADMTYNYTVYIQCTYTVYTHCILKLHTPNQYTENSRSAPSTHHIQQCQMEVADQTHWGSFQGGWSQLRKKQQPIYFDQWLTFCINLQRVGLKNSLTTGTDFWLSLIFSSVLVKQNGDIWVNEFAILMCILSATAKNHLCFFQWRVCDDTGVNGVDIST